MLDDDGTEGIPAAIGVNGMIVPMVAADAARIEDCRAFITRDPALAGKRITLAHFTVRHDVEVIQR